MINSSQTVTGTLMLDGFGNYVTSTGSSSNPYMFAATSGYRNDNDAGLCHVGARYYDAQVGRFLTRDTFLDQHPYLYCEHDPVNALDPSGHLPDWLKGALITAGVGSLVAVGAAIAMPVVAATVVGGVAIGAVAGAAGAIAGYGYTTPVDDISMDGIGKAAGGGAIGGAITGGVTGSAVMPWIGKLLGPIRPKIPPTSLANLLRVSKSIQ